MIPRIIHQTWKTADIPQRFQPLVTTWRTHHPDWQYLLWSDADNRAFIAAHYPEFLPIFDAYASPICRADAVRYFLLKHFGGLYADLDFECLRPFDDLIDCNAVLIGLEPPAHVRDHRIQQAARNRPTDLVRMHCNALMASPPGHPFWDHVINLMIEAHAEPDPLYATGPLLLTRAAETYSGSLPITIFEAPVFYPADVYDCSEGRLFDLEYWHKLTGRSHAIHHWAGTWWRESTDQPDLPSASARITLLTANRKLGELILSTRDARPLGDEAPLVSCLMVTRNRPAQGKLAVQAFIEQTYSARELIILDDGEDDGLHLHVNALADPRIRLFRLSETGATLGELRNRAVNLARGAYVCQWDDDDLYDSARLATQMTVIMMLAADACFLSRWMIWWPDKQRLSVSTPRIWEGSMVCRKAIMPPYPALRRGEDTAITDHIVANARVALLDQPRLYLYVAHAGNTFQAEHFEAHWQASSYRFEGEDYARALQELGKRLPVRDYLVPPRALKAEPEIFPAEPTTPDLVTVPVTKPNQRAVHRPAESSLPTVLILTPIRNAAHFIENYFRRLDTLDYPKSKLSIAFLEGDSEDDTLAVLHDHAERWHSRFARIAIFQRAFGHRIEGPRWAPEIQYLRRAVLAKCRNTLFKQADQGEQEILWLDADVIDYPADVLLRLQEAGKPIIVPHCVKSPGGPSFDLNTFRYKSDSGVSVWNHLRDGIVQPPPGTSQLGLDASRGQDLVKVDGVGGTMLLVDAAIHRAGILFPDYSYRGHIETEGFAMLAKDRGYQSWGMPDLEIIHVDA